MITLLDLQRRVAAAVMEPVTRDYQMRRRSLTGRSVFNEANELIKPNGRLTSFERLEIYNRQYWFRILASFEEDFPGLRAIVGLRKFNALMRAYLADCPSVSFTLRNLGSQLERWLGEHTGRAAPYHQLALDMVRLEWAYIEAFDGGSHPVLTPAEVDTAGDDLQIRLQPYIRLLQLNYAVNDLLIEVHTKAAAAGMTSNAVAEPRKRIQLRRYSKPETGCIFLAVHRLESTIYYKRLSGEAYSLLLAMQSGTCSLSDALDRAFGNSSIVPEEQAGLLQHWFATWSELGWFCRFTDQA